MYVPLPYEFIVLRTLILYLSNGRFSGVEPRYTFCKKGLEVTGPTRGVEITLRRSPQMPFDTCIFAFMIQTSNHAFPIISKFALTNSQFSTMSAFQGSFFF
jgi:hypothetical protein